MIDFAGGEPQREFAAPASTMQSLNWSADGRALLYVDRRGGVSNIWSQPLSGGAAKQITDFRQDEIFSFSLSLDGKRLAYSRGAITQDVVMLKDVGSQTPGNKPVR